MNIKIISVGKIKEKYFQDAIKEYSKRLSKYCNLKIIEVADEKTKENASDKETDIILSKEKDRLINNIKDNEYVIALDIKGKKLDSVEFSEELNKLAISGKPNVDFIIGGSMGLHKEVLDMANLQLSFSDMTFPHQLMRVVLSEQIYRAFRIINNEPYHK